MKDLKKANNIIEEIAKKYKEITPVTPKDMPLFEKFFKKEPHTYGNSWTYVTQGMYGIGPFGLGYKYYDGKNLSAIAIYPKIEHPNIYCFYWVRPMGPQILDIINKFAKNLLETQSIPTYVKKIFKEQFEYLKNKGFKDTSGFPWYSNSRSEDDTYPEQIVKVEKSLRAAKLSKKNTKLHRAYQYYRHFMNKNDLQLRSVLTDFKVDQKILIQFFKYQKQIRKNNVSGPDDFYNLILYPQKKESIIEELILDNKIPVGFYYAIKQYQSYVSLYATITLREISNNLADFMMFQLLTNIKKSKLSYLNLGGSESSSLNEFKKKFLPVKELQMYWVCLYTN